MRSRGIPLHEDADQALQMAVAMVNGFKGHPALLPEPLMFTQRLVLDTLAVAPTPISYSWMRITLGVVAALARWGHNTGQPLTREHLLTEENRYRFNATLTHMKESSRNLYWVRLQLVADFINGVTPNRVLPKPTRTDEAPRTPLTLADEADLWIWASSIRRNMRRPRMKAIVTLGLGCGLTGGELVRCTRDHIEVTETGVHVRIEDAAFGGDRRVVTCRRDWEDRLAALCDEVAEGRHMLTPWREDGTSASQTTAVQSTKRAMVGAPVPFNATRLRNTWLCHHMSVGTPLKVLMTAAGMKEANHLHNLLQVMDDVPAAVAAEFLRGV